MDLTNWGGNLQYEAVEVSYPTSVGAVSDVVSRSNHVKALGTRHSFTTVADSPGGALVSLDAFDPGVIIDETMMTASVSGGTSYGVFASELQSRGFALHNMGSLPHISVAGATATGTHGSGDSNQVLSAAISAVELVKADGTVVSIDRANTDLVAIAVGLGAFGVITRVTFDIQPSYLVRQDLYRDAPWELVLDGLDELMASAYSVNLLGDFAAPTLHTIWQKSRVEPALDGSIPQTDAPNTLCGGTYYDGADAPPDSSHTVIGGVPGPWSERLPHFRLDAAPSAGGDELQTEYFVHRSHGVAALTVLREIGEQISPHLRASEIRTVAADDLWLSPAYQRDTLSIGFTWHKHVREVQALLPIIEKALAPYEPRAHWGKLFALGSSDLVPRFDRLTDFLELAKEYDPTGKFANPFMMRLTH